MPGNSQRRGAIRKSGKGPTVGSGGQRRRGLEGKGPTPKATERDYHPAAKRAKRAPNVPRRAPLTALAADQSSIPSDDTRRADRHQEVSP